MNKAEYQTYLASREWALLREAVRRRSGGFCERCRRRPQEAVHHLTYERVGRELLTDLQAICDPCHEFLSGKCHDDPAAAVPIDRQFPTEQPKNRSSTGLVEKWLHREQIPNTEDEAEDEEDDDTEADELEEQRQLWANLKELGEHLVEDYGVDTAYLDPEELIGARIRWSRDRETYEQAADALNQLCHGMGSRRGEESIDDFAGALLEWEEYDVMEPTPEDLRELYANDAGLLEALRLPRPPRKPA